MPPRKSVSARNKQQQQSVASSSKVTLDALPPPNIPENLTPDFQPNKRVKTTLVQEEREALVHELTGFSAAGHLLKIEEDARTRVTNTVGTVENWARAIAKRQDGGTELEREIDIGSFQLETLMDSHIDKAFDKFTAWTLRNAFDFQKDLELVLPWQNGMDFDRGEYVANLPKGEESVKEMIEELRAKVEQARLLSYRLALAEKQMDRRLDLARQRNAQVGFVKEILASSNLAPLPPKAQSIVTALEGLHQTVSSLETLPPTETKIPPGTKAWEMGRHAYLNWAVGKMIHPDSKDDTLESAEILMEQGGGQEGLDKLSRAVGA